MLQFYPLKEILFSKFVLTQSKNKNGYRFFIKVSISHVIYSTLSLFHNTFIICMTLFLKTFIFWSTIPTYCTSNDKSSLSSTGGASKTWEEFDIYFLNIETWKTSWMHSKSHGNSNDGLPNQSFQEFEMVQCTKGSISLTFEI